MNKRTIRNQQGVSLLEVMVAIILISVALMMLLHLSMIALDSNEWSDKTTTSTQAMEQKLEQLRSMDLTDVHSGTDTVRGLTRTWTVSSEANHLRQVDVEVSWSDLESRPHTNRLTTFIRTDSL